MQVPTLSIVFMGVSCALCILLPIALFFWFRAKYGAKLLPAGVGAVAFVLFVLVLEAIVHNLVLQPAADGTIALRQNPVLFMLYGGFMAGLFEETARFLCFLMLRKRYGGIGTALSYGVGHGGIEAILLAGIAMISNFSTAIMINTGALQAASGTLSGEAQASVDAAVKALSEAPSAMFLVSGIERVFAIAIQISLSVLVFYAVYLKGTKWLYPVAIVLHAVIDFPAALFQTGAITNVVLVEVIVGLSAVALVVIALVVHRKLRGRLPQAPVAPPPAETPAYTPPAPGEAPPPQDPS